MQQTLLKQPVILLREEKKIGKLGNDNDQSEFFTKNN